MVRPSSRFSKTAETGMRVPRKTHAPLTFPGMLSTAGHCDQSSAIIDLTVYPSERFAGLQALSSKSLLARSPVFVFVFLLVAQALDGIKLGGAAGGYRAK